MAVKCLTKTNELCQTGRSVCHVRDNTVLSNTHQCQNTIQALCEVWSVSGKRMRFLLSCGKIVFKLN